MTTIGAALNASASPRTRLSAGPIAAGRSAARTAPSAAKDVLRAILDSLDDMKAEDTVTIDITGKSAFADTMLVTSGRSNRHVGAIADRVVESLHKAGVKDLRVEGRKNSDWVLIDAGDIVLHVFRPEVRAFYEIEKMWAGTRG